MEKEKKFIPSQTNASKIRRKIGEQYILAAKMIKANKGDDTNVYSCP